MAHEEAVAGSTMVGSMVGSHDGGGDDASFRMGRVGRMAVARGTVDAHHKVEVAGRGMAGDRSMAVVHGSAYVHHMAGGRMEACPMGSGDDGLPMGPFRTGASTPSSSYGALAIS